MGGLARLCKAYGEMEITANGKKTLWVWDYVKNKPRIKDEMTQEELAASERAKWMSLKK